jgi:hypothetical protein
MIGGKETNKAEDRAFARCNDFTVWVKGKIECMPGTTQQFRFNCFWMLRWTLGLSEIKSRSINQWVMLSPVKEDRERVQKSETQQVLVNARSAA